MKDMCIWYTLRWYPMPGDKKRYTRSRNVACKIAYPNRKQYILYLKPTKEINPSLLNTKKGKENF